MVGLPNREPKMTVINMLRALMQNEGNIERTDWLYKQRDENIKNKK